jgi:hypothetical protein
MMVIKNACHQSTRAAFKSSLHVNIGQKLVDISLLQKDINIGLLYFVEHTICLGPDLQW